MGMEKKAGETIRRLYDFFILLAPGVFMAGMFQVNFQKFLPYQRIFKGVNFFDYFTVTDIYITFMAVIFIFGLIKGIFNDDEERGVKKKLPLELLLCIGLVCLAGILELLFQKVYEPVLSTPIEYFRGFFIYPIIFTVMLLRSANASLTERLVKSYVLFVIFFCILALAQYLFGIFPGAQYDFTKRLVWPYVDFVTLQASSANWVAFFVAPAFLLSFFNLVNLVKTGPIFKGAKLNNGVILYNSGMLLGALVLFLTQSYGAWAAVFLAIAFYLFRALKLKHFLIILCVMLVSIGGVFLIIKSSYKYKIMTGQQAYKYDNSIVSRFDIYKMDMSMIAAHPFLGVGFNQFQSYFTTYQEQVLGHKYMESQIPPHAHNFFVGMWISLGVLGFLGMLILVFGIFWRCKFKPDNPAAFVLLAIMIHGLVDSYYWRQEIAYTFWLIVALCYLYRVRKTE
jgi:O-antigen ligase